MFVKEDRPYQDYALTAIKNWIKYKPDSNGYVKAPGGSGKSVLIAKTAEFCFDAGKRIIILARNEKLLTQNRDKFSPEYWQHIGIYCAGIGEKILHRPITIASIQSIYSMGEALNGGNLILLIDEVQNLHPDDESDTQYWKFIKAIGEPQIIGFTATDWRTASGSLNFGDKICEIPIQALIDGGWLIPPAPPKTPGDIDLSDVQIVRGEYNGQQLEDIYLEPELLAKSIEALQKYAKDRHSVVIFTQSRKHGKVLQQAMLDNGFSNVVYVDGETPKDELSLTLDSFARREFKYLINVALLIEGWDCPPIDCIAIFTSTVSRGKFEQIVYRGTRPAPHLNKTSFTVIDLGGNFRRHGALGSPYKEKSKKEAKREIGRICPVCESWFPGANIRECSDCGYVFPEPENSKVDHNHNPDTESKTIYTGETEIYTVTGVSYHEHVSRKKGTTSLRVDYHCPGANKYGAISEWLSPHNTSEYARGKAHSFFKERGWDAFGGIWNYDMQTLLYHAGNLKKPSQIVVDHSEKFPKIIKYIWDEMKMEPQKTMDEILDGDFIPY